MDPWEIVAIVSLVFLGIIAIRSASTASLSFNTSGITSALSSVFFAITNFIPFGLLTFGIIADVIGQEVRYSIGSLIGVTTIIVNYLAKFVLEPFMSIPPPTLTSSTDSGKAWCFIPGLDSFENRASPMNFAVTSSIMVYYLIFAALNRQPGQNISIGIAFPALFLIQIGTFYFGECNQYYPSGTTGKLIAVVLGAIVGALGYSAVNMWDPAKAPFGYAVSGPSASGYQSGPVTAPRTVGAPQNGAKCSAANTDDDNAYVCEAYKNGVLVTEKIS